MNTNAEHSLVQIAIDAACERALDVYCIADDYTRAVEIIKRNAALLSVIARVRETYPSFDPEQVAMLQGVAAKEIEYGSRLANALEQAYREAPHATFH